MNRLLALPSFRFTTNKYFKDSKFKNVTALSEDRMGTLKNICQIFNSNGANLSYVRTHFTNIETAGHKNYRIELSYYNEPGVNFHKIAKQLEGKSISLTETDSIKIPWFPKNVEEVNLIGKDLMDVKEEKDHIQFTDEEYKKRRNFLAEVAQNYRMGTSIPDVEYTKEETELWVKIYQRLKPLHNKGMSHVFRQNIKELQQEFHLEKRIPQLNQLSRYLKSKSGFQIKPTHGILSSREFLNCLAFKLFCSTQYIRNWKTPEYTPEPDICHQILGHVPMFADPDVARISQKIGLLSLGASTEELKKLGTIYWFTLQFGVCKEANEYLGYGAGIASSIAELEHMMSKDARFKKLDPYFDCTQPYPIQLVQPLYRVTESYSESIADLEKYGRTVMKPVTTIYNQKTGEIEYDRNIECIYSKEE